MRLEKGLQVGIVTALQIERDAFFEALKFHNDLFNQPTKIEPVFLPKIQNTVYHSEIFYKDPISPNSNLKSFNVGVLTNKAMGCVSAKRGTLNLLNYMESFPNPNNDSKFFSMVGICAGSSKKSIKKSTVIDKKLQFCDVIVADPCFLINETAQKELEKEEEINDFWFSNENSVSMQLPSPPQRIKTWDKDGILGINKELKEFIQKNFVGGQDENKRILKNWEKNMRNLEIETKFSERLKKSYSNSKNPPVLRNVDAIITAMGTTDRIRNDGGNVFDEADITFPNTISIDMESYMVYKTVWMWDIYQKNLKKYFGKQTVIHPKTHRIVVKSIVDFADENMDEVFYDIAGKTSASFVIDLIKEFLPKQIKQ